MYGVVTQNESELSRSVFDRTMYEVKSDYREAAMIVAQRNSELAAEVLREWDYDLEAT